MIQPNPDLVKFIKEARKRGFDDFDIRTPLAKQGWPVVEIERAFASLRRKQREHYHFKNKVTLYLQNDILKGIEKRAKKNLLTLPEQVEDILRRSCINQIKKSSSPKEKLDDLLIGIFSRQNKGKKK